MSEAMESTMEGTHTRFLRHTTGKRVRRNLYRTLVALEVWGSSGGRKDAVGGHINWPQAGDISPFGVVSPHF